MANSAEVLRIGKLLESLIAFKKVTVRQVERQLEVSNGTLSRILNGKIELKLRHILDILDIIGIPPEVFFKIAYQIKDIDDETSDEALSHLRQIAQPQPAPATGFGRDQVEAVVHEVLRKLDIIPPAPDKRAGRGPRSRKTGPE